MRILLSLILLIVFIFLPLSSFAQDMQLEVLKNEIKELQKTVQVLTSELQSIKSQQNQEENNNENTITNNETIKLNEGNNKLTELEGRVEEVEKAQIEQAQKKGLVSTFNSESIKFGGYGDISFDSKFGKDTRGTNSFSSDLVLQASANIKERFNFFTATFLNFKPQFLSQNSPFRNNGPVSVEVHPDIFFGEYAFKDWLILKAGHFNAPFGIINQEFYSPLLVMHDKPQALRNITTFDTLPVGIQLYGTKRFKNQLFGYHAYTSSTITSTRDLGGGGRIFWSTPNEFLTLGASHQILKRNFIDYNNIFGGDLKLKYRNFILRSEFISGLIDDFRDQIGYYVQPSLNFLNGKLIVFAQADYLDDTFGSGNRLGHHEEFHTFDPFRSPIKKYEYTFGINYLPKPFIRNRLEFTTHDYMGTNLFRGFSRDYFSVQASSTLSF